MDHYSAVAIATRLEGIRRRADTFGHDRAHVLEEIEFLSKHYRLWAAKIEEEMLETA